MVMRGGYLYSHSGKRLNAKPKSKAGLKRQERAIKADEARRAKKKPTKKK